MKPYISNKKLFEDLFVGAPKEILICSPWISKDGVGLLREALSRISVAKLKTLGVWLRISLEDHLQQRTDYVGLLNLLQDFKHRSQKTRIAIAKADNLHAKVYRVDSMALIGSANLTTAGFGGGNLEIVGWCTDTESKQLARVMAEMGKGLRSVSMQEFEHYCNKLNEVPVEVFQKDYSRLLRKFSQQHPPHYEMIFR
jgi:phosphatidylserine/phosphatidylglycerophosphate/cardiolipin synthase-like enzyme